VIGIWCALAFAVVPAVDSAVQGSKERSEYAALAIAALMATLAGVLRLMDRRRAK